MEIKRSEFTEETIYIAQCPSCGEYIEINDDPQYEEEVTCDSCGKIFDLVD